MTPFTPKAHTPTHPGELTLVRIAPPGQSTQTAFFIRDTTGTVNGFGRMPGIAGRFRRLDYQQQVLVVAIALKVRTPREPVYYQVWLDLQNRDACTALFVDLAVQPTLTIQFFGDGGRPLTACMMKNAFGAFARNVLHELEQYSQWTHDDYQRAEADLRERYPSPFALWQALGKDGLSEPLVNPIPTGPSPL